MKNILCLLLLGLLFWQSGLLGAEESDYKPIDISLFRDSIHHWQMKDGRGREDERYEPEQIVEIADNLLAFQNDDGGWAPNLDWLLKLSYDEVFAIRGRALKRSSFDNRNTYPQIDYLAKVYQVTGRERYRLAAAKGLDYILAEQRPSGGWRGKDVDAITYNDDVMVGIMNLLLMIQNDEPQYKWLDKTKRKQLEESLKRAMDVTLKCQIVVDGKKTAWCQQHDHGSLKPVKARAYELPSITALESVGVVRFLMKLKQPSPEVIEAIEGAVAWFEKSRIDGLRVKTIKIKPNRFEQYTAKIDRVVVPDENAPPLWARFYEVETNRPFFCNRDGIKVYQLSEVKLERRAGYAWYGGWPEKILKVEYPRWKKRIGL